MSPVVLAARKEEVCRLVEEDGVGVAVQGAGDELEGVVLVGGEGQLQGLAEVTRLLVQDHGLVELRPLGGLVVSGGGGGGGDSGGCSAVQCSGCGGSGGQNCKQLFMYKNNWDKGVAPAICPYILSACEN